MYLLAMDNNYCCPNESCFSLTNLPSIPGSWFLHLRFPSLFMYTDVFMFMYTGVPVCVTHMENRSPYLVSHSIAFSLTNVMRQVSYWSGELTDSAKVGWSASEVLLPLLP